MNGIETSDVQRIR